VDFPAETACGSAPVLREEDLCHDLHLGSLLVVAGSIIKTTIRSGFSLVMLAAQIRGLGFSLFTRRY